MSISFTPVEYGKVKIGTLIVQTPTRYWSYRIEGGFPKMELPEIESRYNAKNFYSKKVKQEDEK